MNQLSQTEKLAQFEEFFAIAHEFSVNVIPLAKAVSEETFESLIPVPFLLSSDNASIDQSALRSIQSMRGVSNQLTDYLQHQSRKIDLLVGYILKQHDDESTRASGVLFGGSGIRFLSEQDYQIGQLVELKIFLDVENVAIYSHAEIIEKGSQAEQTCYTVIFQQIRELDQDILVRASLHIQAKELQMLAKQRRESAKE
ncbi:PilZ domain-containing protein [Thalassotalea sp. LPB0316]|uniref:PilZ domain-containing protein n=1 Tax=Thalassotalea sp. LPB0316 TaxID=2769490 RepID=UPI00186750E0|nr:PilZ domain-containing protein [Thalassotalea sp. LPB0316]QOL24475.1 PilZ domain-containing protein [Thalassotalea sp. LPB0316]